MQTRGKMESKYDDDWANWAAGRHGPMKEAQEGREMLHSHQGQRSGTGTEDSSCFLAQHAQEHPAPPWFPHSQEAEAGWVPVGLPGQVPWASLTVTPALLWWTMSQVTLLYQPPSEFLSSLKCKALQTADTSPSWLPYTLCFAYYRLYFSEAWNTQRCKQLHLTILHYENLIMDSQLTLCPCTFIHLTPPPKYCTLFCTWKETWI